MNLLLSVDLFFSNDTSNLVMKDLAFAAVIVYTKLVFGPNRFQREQQLCIQKCLLIFKFGYGLGWGVVNGWWS